MSLELQGVSQVVDGQLHIAPTDLVLEKGTMNVLLGPTSSGKTSLMRLMAGLDKPSTGRILSSGKDVTNQRVQLRNVAMVYQEFINYPGMTVFDNIASPLRLKGQPKADIDRTVRTTAEMLKLTSILHRRPLELSGGQQQRVAIARALMQDPRIILADEPIASLDPMNAQVAMQSLRDIHEQDGRMVIANLHTLDTARRYCDRVIGMRGGKIVFDGTPEQLTTGVARERTHFLGRSG